LICSFISYTCCFKHPPWCLVQIMLYSFTPPSRKFSLMSSLVAGLQTSDFLYSISEYKLEYDFHYLHHHQHFLHHHLGHYISCLLPTLNRNYARKPVLCKQHKNDTVLRYSTTECNTATKYIINVIPYG
jgi:hypothetical protein